jgi:hypothetical protein
MQRVVRAAQLRSIDSLERRTIRHRQHSIDRHAARVVAVPVECEAVREVVNERTTMSSAGSAPAGVVEFDVETGDLEYAALSVNVVAYEPDVAHAGSSLESSIVSLCQDATPGLPE